MIMHTIKQISLVIVVGACSALSAMEQASTLDRAAQPFYRNLESPAIKLIVENLKKEIATDKPLTNILLHGGLSHVNRRAAYEIARESGLDVKYIALGDFQSLTQKEAVERVNALFAQANSVAKKTMLIFDNFERLNRTINSEPLWHALSLQIQMRSERPSSKLLVVALIKSANDLDELFNKRFAIYEI